MSGTSFTKGRILRTTVLLGALLMLAACEEGQTPGFLKGKASADGEEVSRSGMGFGGQAVERDVEAPDIFSAKEAGLWDGRPSLGGVWVAHPDVTEPERVIIRNTTNGKFVIGALFRKERSSPGPRLQVSSDAAAAIGMLAGQPANLDVVALRREQVTPEPEADVATDATALAAAGGMPAAPEVSEGTLDPVLDSASKALDAGQTSEMLDPAPVQTAAVAAAPAPSPVAAPAAAPAPKPAAKASALSKPFLQIGIFSVEQNAKNTAVAMRQAGMVPTIKPGESSGKPFWRVVVGPAQTAAERDQLLAKVKDSGFTDAYAVSD